MLTEQVNMKKKDNDKIKKSVQTSSACVVSSHRAVIADYKVARAKMRTY